MYCHSPSLLPVVPVPLFRLVWLVSGQGQFSKSRPFGDCVGPTYLVQPRSRITLEQSMISSLFYQVQEQQVGVDLRHEANHQSDADTRRRRRRCTWICSRPRRPRRPLRGTFWGRLSQPSSKDHHYGADRDARIRWPFARRILQNSEETKVCRQIRRKGQEHHNRTRQDWTHHITNEAGQVCHQFGCKEWHSRRARIIVQFAY